VLYIAVIPREINQAGLLASSKSRVRARLECSVIVERHTDVINDNFTLIDFEKNPLKALLSFDVDNVVFVIPAGRLQRSNPYQVFLEISICPAVNQYFFVSVAAVSVVVLNSARIIVPRAFVVPGTFFITRAVVRPAVLATSILVSV
jgi:hypothetical protein